MKQYNDVVTPILDQAKVQPNHVAFVFKGRTITYQEFVQEARLAAYQLQELGVKKADRVAVTAGNRPEIMIIYMGLALLGAAIVPINPEYGEKEIRHILAHSEASLLIYADSLCSHVESAVNANPTSITLQSMEALVDAWQDGACYGGQPQGGGDDLVLLCYTSGTTSTPKGVAATHANELASAFAYRDMWKITPNDSLLVTLPLTFAYGFHAAAFVALVSGATILLSEKFHPRLALESIELQKPTVFLGVPTMYAMMADVAAKESRRFDVSSLRMAAASGAALNEQTIEDCRSRLGMIVKPYYAMTEVRPIFCFDIQDVEDKHRGSVGRLIPPTEVRIVGENGEDVPAGQRGELWVKGPSYSGAYYKDPIRTSEAMQNDWFKTGDIFYEKDDHYYIVGRIKDQIISGGAKIAPIEVEEAVLSLPGIAAVAVVGVPDSTYGQVVKAVIVKENAELGVEAIKSHCENLIADYKMPRIWEFVEDLPRSPAGKVLKSALV
ncbi:class I adenylate-forming enzyme family protein [Advenella sp. RU8]|uniref:class I adenylate-forming enzyme family protein n=1 Tax=Advenella sp. RU8 TaxID=3399575 RepID=UPI003AAC7606